MPASFVAFPETHVPLRSGGTIGGPVLHLTLSPWGRTLTGVGKRVEHAKTGAVGARHAVPLPRVRCESARVVQARLDVLKREPGIVGKQFIQ